MFPVIHAVAGGGGGGANYFGDGRDGAVVWSGTPSIPSVEDGDPVIIHATTLQVDAGAFVRPSNRCKAFLIYVQGDAVIDGEISMTHRGAYSADALTEDVRIYRQLPGGDSPVDAQPFSGFPDETQVGGPGLDYYGAPAEGAPQVGAVTTGWNDGNAGVDGQTGSGASGGSTGGASAAGGRPGTGYGGGPGGGGTGHNGNTYVGSGWGVNWGGQGGQGGNGGSHTNQSGGGGGAGNPGGPISGGTGAGVAEPGQSGSGGVLILVVGGNLTFGAASAIRANGADGGNSGQGASQSNSGNGGGGSGGGSIAIMHAGNLTDNGVSISANGGTYGINRWYPSQHGGTGGAGSIVGPVQIDP